MKKFLFGVLVFAFPTFLVGQTNLVPNSGFEDTIRCPEDSTITKALYWFTPTSVGSPDYFYPTMTGCWACMSMYPNLWGGGGYTNNQGYQLPHSGIGYAGEGLTDGSENMAILLLDSLRAGKKYAVRGFTSMASSSRSAIDLIQFGFSRNNPAVYDTTGNETWICDSIHEYCGNQPYNFITDTSGWVLINDTFYAQGGEKYLIIGNFDTANTHYQTIDTANPSRFAYYYFDDFDVHCIDCNTGISSPPVFGDISLTPNPGDGNFQLKGNFPAGTKLQIFDMLGQKISDMEIAQGNQTVVLSLTLAEAVYLYHLDAGGQQLKTGKLVIQR